MFGAGAEEVTDMVSERDPVKFSERVSDTFPEEEGRMESEDMTSRRCRATAGAGSMTATEGPAIFLMTSMRKG